MMANSVTVEYKITWNKHCEVLMEEFAAQREAGSSTDIEFQCHGGTLKAHKLILAHFSPYFKSIFESYANVEKIIFTNIPFAAVSCVFSLIYTGKTNVPAELFTTVRLLGAGLKLDGFNYYPNLTKLIVQGKGSNYQVVYNQFWVAAKEEIPLAD